MYHFIYDMNDTLRELAKIGYHCKNNADSVLYFY